MSDPYREWWERELAEIARRWAVPFGPQTIRIPRDPNYREPGPTLRSVRVVRKRGKL